MIGIISDIHGNYAALSAVLAALDAAEIETILCLGDVMGYYPEVNECCSTLRQRNIHTLLGNHDWYITTGASCPRSDSANRCLDYQRRIIERDHLDWLKTLSPAAIFESLHLAHGGWRDALDEYVRPSENYFRGLEGNFFVSGHTHVPCLWRKDGMSYCNPGAVGQPRDGDPRASYALWDGRVFALHRVEYDISATQAAMRKAGFPAYFYENLNTGARIGGMVDSPFDEE